VAFASGENPAAIWPGVAEAIYRFRRAEKLAGETDFAMVMDITAAQPAAADAMRRYSYRAFETDPDMVLEIPTAWKNFDGYLAELNKKYRKAAKGIASDVEKAGFKVERLTGLSAHAARLHALYMQVHAHNSMRLVTLHAQYLPALEEALGQDFRCTVVRRGDEIAGFVTTLKDGDTAVGYYIGHDYAANAEAPIYLRLLQAVFADAIELGCKRVSYGRTALEPKARLGAQARPLQVLIRHRNPMLNAIMRRALRPLVPKNEAPERNPFKE
jgi:hypothetical protein